MAEHLRVKWLLSVFTIGLLAPFAAFVGIYLSSWGGMVIRDNLMHILLTIIVGAFSIYSAYYYLELYSSVSDHRLFFASWASITFAFGIILHGLVIFTDKLIPSQQAIFEITEHYGIFVSALLFSGVLVPARYMKSLFKYRNFVNMAIVSSLMIVLAFILYLPSISARLHGMIDYTQGASTFIFLVLALYLAFRFANNGDLVLLYFIFAFSVFSVWGIVPKFYEEWNILWWYAHLIFPTGYTAIFIGYINFKHHDLEFGEFFGSFPFYKKFATKLAVALFLAGFVPLLLMGGLMFITVEQELLSSFNLLLFRLILSIMLLFVLAAFFAFSFSGKFILPLRKLQEAADFMAAGDLRYRVKISTGDEIEELADSFNAMASRIEGSQMKLKEKVEKGTDELDQKIKELEHFNALMIGRELKMVELKQEISELKNKLGLAEGGVKTNSK